MVHIKMVIAETFTPPRPQKSVHIDHWSWGHRDEVRMWLVKNFGVHGDRWYEQADQGLNDLVMDDDVYTWYQMRWEA